MFIDILQIMPRKHILVKHNLYHLGMVKKNLVGNRVQQARKATEPLMTQADLAARLQVLGMSVDQSGISKIETGERPVSDIEVVALADALKVSAAWLLAVEA